MRPINIHFLRNLTPETLDRLRIEHPELRSQIEDLRDLLDADRNHDGFIREDEVSILQMDAFRRIAAPFNRGVDLRFLGELPPGTLEFFRRQATDSNITRQLDDLNLLQQADLDRDGFIEEEEGVRVLRREAEARGVTLTAAQVDEGIGPVMNRFEDTAAPLRHVIENRSLPLSDLRRLMRARGDQPQDSFHVTLSRLDHNYTGSLEVSDFRRGLLEGLHPTIAFLGETAEDLRRSERNHRNDNWTTHCHYISWIPARISEGMHSLAPSLVDERSDWGTRVDEVADARYFPRLDAIDRLRTTASRHPSEDLDSILGRMREAGHTRDVQILESDLRIHETERFLTPPSRHDIGMIAIDQIREQRNRLRDRIWRRGVSLPLPFEGFSTSPSLGLNPDAPIHFPFPDSGATIELGSSSHDFSPSLVSTLPNSGGVIDLSPALGRPSAETTLHDSVPNIFGETPFVFASDEQLLRALNSLIQAWSLEPQADLDTVLERMRRAGQELDAGILETDPSVRRAFEIAPLIAQWRNGRALAEALTQGTEHLTLTDIGLHEWTHMPWHTRNYVAADRIYRYFETEEHRGENGEIIVRIPSVVRDEARELRVDMNGDSNDILSAGYWRNAPASATTFDGVWDRGVSLVFDFAVAVVVTRGLGLLARGAWALTGGRIASYVASQGGWVAWGARTFFGYDMVAAQQAVSRQLILEAAAAPVLEGAATTATTTAATTVTETVVTEAVRQSTLRTIGLGALRVGGVLNRGLHRTFTAAGIATGTGVLQHSMRTLVIPDENPLDFIRLSDSTRGSSLQTQEDLDQAALLNLVNAYLQINADRERAGLERSEPTDFQATSAGRGR